MNKITLNLGGKDRDFHFGIGFIGLFLEKSGIAMSDIDEKIKENPFKIICIFDKNINLKIKILWH